MIGILLPWLKPPCGSRPQRLSHGRIPVFALPRLFRRAGPVPANLRLLCPCILHALAQRSDGILPRQRCCSALGCASVPWRHVVMLKAANEFWKKWEFRALARNPKRNKVGRMPA